MKKSMKKLLSLVMVIAALAALTVPALAADAVVSRQGTNGLVIETTGSGYTDTQPFWQLQKRHARRRADREHHDQKQRQRL